MEALIPILIPATFVLSLVLDRLFPARPLPKVRGWLLKGCVFFVISGGINTLVPALLAEALGAYSPLDLRGLNLLGSAALVLLLTELMLYWQHRLVHNVHFLWRWTHQMHHSAERLDVAGGVYFHPFDMAVSAALSGMVAILLGVSADAAALAGYATFLFAMFQHLNVKTPRRLGYFVQRPEGHSVHHARGVHAYNYGNLALWDLAFGTFRNPQHFVNEQGFWEGASGRIAALLAGRDIGEPTHQPPPAMHVAAAE